MSNKRAYSTYLSSGSVGMLVTANGFDAPPSQTQRETTYSLPRIHVPGSWPSEHDANATQGAAIQEAAPAHSSFFTTFSRWAATVSIANLLNLPVRLAQRFLRKQTIKAIPVIGSNGSNKKRLIAVGVADEVATPSPSVRARANQARRQNVLRATATSPQFPYGTLTSYQTAQTPSPTTYLTPPPTSLYAPDDQHDEDISMEFEFENILTSTPPHNSQTGSPIDVPWDSPQLLPWSNTPLQSLVGRTSHMVESPPKLPWSNTPLQSPMGRTSPAAESPCPKGNAGSKLRIGRGRSSCRAQSSLTPMRRQLVKLQFGVGSGRLHTPQEAEVQTDAPEEDFAETEPVSDPTQTVHPELSDLPTASSTTFQIKVNSPLDQSFDAKSLHDEIELADPFEYANDLSFLTDASSPPRGVRWTKHSDVKHFFYDAKVTDMIDETLESITSEHETSFAFWTGRGRRNRENISFDDEPSSPSGSSAAGSPTNEEEKDDIDNSLEESMISDELLGSLHEAFMNKIALEALAAPPPPPPKPLVTPLSTEELETVKAAAEQTKNGRLPNKWVVEEKLYARDFATLLPRMFNGDLKAWLNDQVVNEYLAMLVAAKKKEHGFEHKRGGPAPPVHAFSSFWYQTGNVSRWAARFQLQGAQYLDAELILYPICHKGHWRLLAVFPKKRHIEYLDSLGLDGDQYINKLKERLQSELGAAFKLDEWTQGSNQRSSQQLNGSDCGVFTLLNALTLLRGDVAERVVADNGMNEARQRIAATLLAGRPTTEFD